MTTYEGPTAPTQNGREITREGASRPSRLALISAGLVTAAVFAGLAIYGLQKISFGIDPSDEGFYVSVPIRYCFGDLPFRDQWDNSLIMYDVLLWGFFELFPEAGLYDVRLLGLAIELLMLAALLAFFWRYTSSSAVTAIACAAVAFTGYGIITPGYNKLGRAGLCFAIVLWLIACRDSSGRTRRIVLSILAAVALFAGVIAYAPLIAVALAPGVVWILAWFRVIRSPSVRAATGVFLLSFLTCGVLFAAALALAGILDDCVELGLWHASTLAQSTRAVRTGDGVIPKLARLGYALARLIPLTLAISGFLLLLRALLSPRAGKIRGAAVTIGVLALLASLRTPHVAHWLSSIPGIWARHPPAAWALSASAAMFLCAAILRTIQAIRGSRSKRSAEWSVVYWGTLSSALIYLVVQGTFSGNGYRNAVFAVPPLFLLALTDLCRSLDGTCAGFRSLNRGTRWLTGAFALLLLYAGTVNLDYDFNRVYRDAPRERLTASFSHRYLKGIRSTPQRVKDLEGVLQYLEPRVKRGDFVHMQEEFAMVYFLLRVRPALPNTWSPLRRGFSREQRQRMLDYMVDNHRIPEYFVQYPCPKPPKNQEGSAEAPLPDDPIHRYFAEHYARVAAFGQYEVWQRTGQ